jgi:tetratricopeptide (TPR) repeat protein
MVVGETIVTRRASVLLALVCAAGLWAAGASGEGPSPISAADAEERVAEARDFLTDMLWANTEQHWHEGRWEDCIRLCRQIVEVDPRFVEAYNGAAWMLWNLDRDEEALEMYHAGIAANDERYEIYHDFGMYYFIHDKWNLAAEQFRKSVECGAPMYYQHMLPNALERGGRRHEALSEWRELLKRFPEDPIAGKHIEALTRELEANPEGR